jgi:hypothetical protein
MSDKGIDTSAEHLPAPNMLPVHDQAQKLVNDSAAFLQNGSSDASAKFALDWQSTVNNGRQFRDQVTTEAAKISQESQSPFHPVAQRTYTWTGLNSGWEDGLGFDNNAPSVKTPARHIEGVADGSIYACPTAVTPNYTNNECSVTQGQENKVSLPPDVMKRAHDDAVKLAGAGEQFIQTGSTEASAEFAQRWKNVAQAGTNYADAVKGEVEKIEEPNDGKFGFAQGRDQNDNGEYGIGETMMHYFGGYMIYRGAGAPPLFNSPRAILGSDDGTVTVSEAKKQTDLVVGPEKVAYNASGAEGREDAIQFENSSNAYAALHVPGALQLMTDVRKKYQQGDASYKDSVAKQLELDGRNVDTDMKMTP